MNFSALALVLAALPAQSQLPSTRLHRITAPVRDAGILHVATNTWTRKLDAASLGADVIYNNTCDSGYFSGLSGDTYVTNGRVPSPSSPTNVSSRPGCALQYEVDGFEIAYCTDQQVPGVFTVEFFNAYDCCASVVGVTPTASIVLAGLPGSGSGLSACWTVVIDLDGPPSSSFVLIADRDGSFNGSPWSTDGFGWSIRNSLTVPAAFATGPIIASAASCVDCPNTDWDGTRWDPLVNYAEPGTGMGTCSAFRIEGGPTPPNCYWFGGCPDPNFHLRLFSDACVAEIDRRFCFGDGIGTPCPCGNTSVGRVGCANSLGIGGGITASGTPSISADSVVLAGSQMPPNSPVLYFQGLFLASGGAGQVFGDGKRCAIGTTTRLGVKTNSGAGTSIYPGSGDPRISARGQITAPSTRTYQAWYRNSASFCTVSTFNLTNGVEIGWAL